MTVPKLYTTHELVDHYAAETGIPRAQLEKAIPKAIDAVYAARDHGRSMHTAGAMAAVAALAAAASASGDPIEQLTGEGRR